MKKPLIGVLPLYDEPMNSLWMLPAYLEAVMCAGGLPMILPLECDMDDIEHLSQVCDGFLFTGGQDVTPVMYHEAATPKLGETALKRDILESSLLRYCVKHDIPVLGICRGIQMINAALGGTLCQDIEAYGPENHIDHRQEKPYDRPGHWVDMVEGSPLQELMREKRMQVTSLHHQCVKTLGKGLVPMAYAPDGIIEAVYAPDQKFLWAVQWHPEFIFQRDMRQLRLLEAFVQACKQ